MGRITEAMLRQRAEHNDGVLDDLQEVALHQFEIERIELLGERCRHLKILLLQNNLIARIENVHKLRELEYLNLALNSIRRVERLEECESLTRLDLTANYIADLASVASLRANYRLRELFLVGNPCAELPCYRQFVIGALPQLAELDGSPVTRTERILAAENWEKNRAEAEAASTAPPPSTPFSPEDRAALYLDLARKRAEAEEAKGVPSDPLAAEKPRKEPPSPVFKDDGSVLQRNEGDWPFEMRDGTLHGEACVELDVAFPKFLSTALINVEPQPRYVRIVAKGKLLQLNFPVEVRPDAGTADRSMTTGHLLLRFPKLVQTPSSVGAGDVSPKPSAAKTAAPTVSKPSERVDPRHIVAVEVDPDMPPLE